MGLLPLNVPPVLIPKEKAPNNRLTKNRVTSILTGAADTETANSTSSSASSAPQRDGKEVLSGYVDLLYSAYKPEKLTYTKQSADELSKEISAWLRPTYEAAIAAREEATATYRAELDADAIARGMGASTYVTDVKSRQLRKEAEDVAALETDYAAQLAKQMSAALENEQQRAFETDLFNAEAENEAYQKAYNMALSMYQTYLSNQSRPGSGGGRPKNDPETEAAAATTPENCEAFLNGLSASERKNVYLGTTETDRAYRAELIASVGSDGYLDLIRKYPVF